MTVEEIVNTEEYRSLVEKYRGMCLWFAPKDVAMHPKCPIQLEQVLSSLESYGDMEAYRRAGRIRKWL